MDSTKRFSDRVKNYLAYRPTYPHEIVKDLQKKAILSDNQIWTDIGAGVGHSTKLFAPLVAKLYAIEPNQAMYDALVEQVSGLAVEPILAVAEATTLPDRSVDGIVCGQAFHWFNLDKVKTEFQRILKESGPVILMWNSRREDYYFGKDYEQFLIHHATDYSQVTHKRMNDAVFDQFFSNWEESKYSNVQSFDLFSLKGRFMSSSYAPRPGSDTYARTMDELEALFLTHQKNGKVQFMYNTQVITGQF